MTRTPMTAAIRPSTQSSGTLDRRSRGTPCFARNRASEIAWRRPDGVHVSPLRGKRTLSRAACGTAAARKFTM